MDQEEADAVAALLAAASGDIPAKRSETGEGLATFMNHPLSALCTSDMGLACMQRRLAIP